MASRLKYNFFKRKNVENLNFMYPWLILVTEILCTQGHSRNLNDNMQTFAFLHELSKIFPGEYLS